jgi:protoheme IX farnesyltransferase
MMGWSAASGEIGLGAWILFGILFLWQLPHFLAIGWMYREDYARGGFPILAVVDGSGVVSGRQAVLWSVALLPISLAPALLQQTGAAYAVSAVACGALMIATSWIFAKSRSMKAARQLFFASIVYLPLVMSLLVITL